MEQRYYTGSYNYIMSHPMKAETINILGFPILTFIISAFLLAYFDFLWDLVYWENKAGRLL